MTQMTGENRALFIQAVGASLLLHLLSMGFFWKVHIAAPNLDVSSPLMVRLVPPTTIPRFIDQPNAPPADRPVKSRDISQVTSQARGPGKTPGPVTSPESLGTPHLPQSSRPSQIAKVVPPAPSVVRPKPPAKPVAPVPETHKVSPPVAKASPSEALANPSRPSPDITLESPEARPPSSSVTTPRGDSPENTLPESPPSFPSFREQIATLGREQLFGKDLDFDAGQIGDTGTSERTISLETQSDEFAPYLATVKHRIENHWLVPRYAREVGFTGRLILVISITREGKLSGLQINKSSGVSILDEAAVNAVTTAAPYDPFPPHFTYRQLNIVANFEYVTRSAPGYPTR